MPLAPLRLDFRLPISPTPSFCNRIRFFCAALRRLGGSYAEAQVHVTVGDHADLDRLRGKNRWAEDFPLTWHRVPDELFDTEGYFGTSDYRYLLAESSADLIILADADTALVKPLGNAFDWMMCERTRHGWTHGARAPSGEVSNALGRGLVALPFSRVCDPVAEGNLPVFDRSEGCLPARPGLLQSRFHRFESGCPEYLQKQDFPNS